MMTKEAIRGIIAYEGAEMASNIVRCPECPYEYECPNINVPTCSLTLQRCNAIYIAELEKQKRKAENMINTLNESQGENKMGMAQYMINTLNKTQGENKMTTMLPNNTVQINPQGEVEGLGSLSLEDLAKLSNAARDLLERKSDEHEQQLWDNVVKAVKEYCEDFGDIVVLLDGDDNLEFNHNQMDYRGEIDCA